MVLPFHLVRQTGPSPVKVSMCYMSRTWSWVEATIWLPSPPIGLTIHIGAQVHGELNPKGGMLAIRNVFPYGGNTEEQARWENLGCKERGRPADGPLNHTTGKGTLGARPPRLLP